MSEKRVTNNITIEGAHIIFKNFSGKETEYNDEGNRNFGVIIDDDEFAEQLKEDGWNIKRLKPKEDEEIGRAWLPVKVKYADYPPIAVLITSKGKIRLNEETIDQLDWTSIENIDLIIRPYNYPARNGKKAGVSAYMKAIYVTVKEDDIESKYADIPYID